jgi:leishmanolysin
MKSPAILEFTKKHFDCTSAAGFPLENEGDEGSLGSHWEKTLLSDEIMISDSAQSDALLTELTLSFL